MADITLKAASWTPTIDDPNLLPCQERLFGRIRRATRAAPVVAVVGAHGNGRTTVLRQFAQEIGAEYFDVERILHAVRPYGRSEQAFVVADMLRRALEKNGSLVFDSYSEVIPLFSHFFSANGQLLAPIIHDLIDRATRSGWRLVLGGNTGPHETAVRESFGEAATVIRCDPLSPEDFEAFFLSRFEGRIQNIDFGVVHGLAPQLNLHQLTYLANRLSTAAVIDFDVIRDCLEQEVLGSNLRLAEVEALSFDRLPGSEHIADALETHVVLPFERPELARELGLRPRRGVLLYGPPGTGKTSIGRALAHRMKGRFFLIDGSVITEPPAAFFGQIDSIVARAKANAPCVLFIDDADVLFQIEHVAGLTRYLLSLLDGIESETARDVCIMMTAMDAAKLPPALLRSGRIELWLETRAPDAETCERILRRWMPVDLLGEDQRDFSRIAERTSGFTPADLRRLASDAKLFYAADVVAGRARESGEHYLDKAIDDLIDLRTTMARRVAEEGQMARYHA